MTFNWKNIFFYLNLCGQSRRCRNFFENEPKEKEMLHLIGLFSKVAFW